MQDHIIDELEEYVRIKYKIEELSYGQLLYHYTSLHGLRGILSTDVLFASESKFLNDSSEIRYIENIINAACDKTEKELAPELIKEVRWFNNCVEWIDTNKVFVLSLSEHSDSLVLWSNYSKHDGYNLGINPYDLREVFFTELKGFKEVDLTQGDHIFLEHGRVIYEPKRQISVVGDELYHLNYIWKKFGQPSERISDFSNRFFCRMLFYSVFLKDVGFNDEREYRIAVTSNKYFSCSEEGRGGFREVNGCLVPYLKLPAKSKAVPGITPIKEIIIGPKNNLDIAKLGLGVFTKEYGYDGVKLRKSAIPLRY